MKTAWNWALRPEQVLLDVFAEFHIPISQIQEMLPAVMLRESQVDLHEGTPFRTLGLANQMHARFIGSPVGLVRIAQDTGANNVFP